MNILFLTMGNFKSIEEHSLYPDLLRCFRNCNHEIYVLARSDSGSFKRIEEFHSHTLKVNIGSALGSGNLIKKGISQLLIDDIYKSALKKYFKDVNFDLVLYSTPPITLYKCIRYVKEKYNAKSYLLLKDIFPQNAVDLGMMKKSGVKGLIYKYFRHKEKRLYAISDRIGCMSQANADYILRHNPEIEPSKVEICPNSIEIRDLRLTEEEKLAMRSKYGIPLDKKVFVYGGNLGRPQSIPFIIDCLRAEKDNDRAFFLIVGDGTEYGKLEQFVNSEKPNNVRLMQRLPKDDYDRMIAACDVGMIFLNHRFTIPNFPSRLLSYMQAGLPVLACTDPNTDIGKVITEGGFGWWCGSDDAGIFGKIINDILHLNDLAGFSSNAQNYLYQHYSAEHSCKLILDRN